MEHHGLLLEKDALLIDSCGEWELYRLRTGPDENHLVDVYSWINRTNGEVKNHKYFDPKPHDKEPQASTEMAVSSPG